LTRRTDGVCAAGGVYKDGWGVDVKCDAVAAVVVVVAAVIGVVDACGGGVDGLVVCDAFEETTSAPTWIGELRSKSEDRPASLPSQLLTLLLLLVLAIDETSRDVAAFRIIPIKSSASSV